MLLMTELLARAPLYESTLEELKHVAIDEYVWLSVALLFYSNRVMSSL
jgi:hypothetical protein